MAILEKTMNPLFELDRLGQSVWMDNFRRGWITSGELKRMFREDALKGVTTNPSIFEKAISGSTDYEDAIRDLAREGKTPREMYEELLIQDIRMAADIFRPVYVATEGTDGFVSIELMPDLAYDTQGSIKEALRLHKLIGRENIMVKVPGTPQGIPVIEELTYHGINVNVTLLFSIDCYEEVAFAYIRGLQRRANDGRLLGGISSVASFFVSRIDTAVDKQLQDLMQTTENSERRKDLEFLLGKTAVVNARMAYQRFKTIFAEPHFKSLEMRGAKAQRVLWASTSTKNPKYKDVYYIEQLIGPQTVNTMPTQTLFAFKDHGHVHPTLEVNLNEAQDVLRRLKEVGIDLDAITLKLQQDGVRSFQKSVDELMNCLEIQREAIADVVNDREVIRIGDYQSRVDYALGALSEQAFSRRLWEKDASLWKQGPEGEKVIKNRLGWLGVVETMMTHTGEISQFAKEVRNAGFQHAVLMGMGGSSLSPEVSRLTFGVKPGYPNLMVLDSTVPSAVLDVERKIDPSKTLFIVSTKSGGTVETMSAYKYFFDKVNAVKGDKASENFVAITDPGSSLEKEANDKKFRRLFLNFEDIGGRYSALSYFGLVPAAVIGIDVEKLLQRAWRMAENSSACVAPPDNASIVLGTVMGELAMEGRNKMTLITSPEIKSFGYWVEQLVAESTGKNGAGVVPVESEPITSPENYGDDRLFIYLRLETSDNTELDAKVEALAKSGQPIVEIHLDDAYDLGQEYFRWEMATGVASALLGVNAFDEPNVKESKDNTSRLINKFMEKGKLPEEKPVLEEDGISLFCDEETKSVLDMIRAAGPYADDSMLSYIAAHLDQFQPGNYFALMAFIEATPAIDNTFACIRGHLRDAYSASTTLGYGPRFLHSTGQLHKGGPNTGVFIQFTCDDTDDAAIPGQKYTFSILKQAQAMGDAISLRSKGCRMIRIHLGKDIASNLNKVLDMVHEAVKEQPE